MNTYISKLGASLIALALVVAPTIALAAAPVVSITSHTNNQEVALNQAITFTSGVTGGSNSKTFAWTFSEGPSLNGPTVSKTFTTTGVKTVTVRVTDSNLETDTETINVNVVDGSTTDVVISNILVASKTSNSATITWTTNIDSTSRVIYDTVSHADISTASKPNYGYAQSTVIDNGKTTTHTVTLTGLSANTQYFFRVLSAK